MPGNTNHERLWDADGLSEVTEKAGGVSAAPSTLSDIAVAEPGIEVGVHAT
jgi:hypothetical protein